MQQLKTFLLDLMIQLIVALVVMADTTSPPAATPTVPIIVLLG